MTLLELKTWAYKQRQNAFSRQEHIDDPYNYGYEDGIIAICSIMLQKCNPVETESRQETHESRMMGA